jgi:hypothetical protein
VLQLVKDTYRQPTSGLKNRLTNLTVANAVELILRRNAIPIVTSCNGGAQNCGKLLVEILANCGKTDLVPSSDRLCAAQIKVQFLENVYSARPGADPSGDLGYRAFCPVWEAPDPILPFLTTDKMLEDQSRRYWSESVENFALFYLRANPTK